MTARELNTTAHKILDAAQGLVQTAGFNAFSYKDLQQEVGVKTSTMHYYFPTKQDLAAALVIRHNEQLIQKLEELKGATSSGLERIRLLGEIFIDIASKGKFCLCGMLTSDLLSMSDAGRQALDDFYCYTEAWLADAITQGIAEGDIDASLHPTEGAANYLATLEGGILIARAKNNKYYMSSIVNQAVHYFKKYA
ncbi:TetR/AcrR family transcriptional regulator [Desulforhopalus sp. 52FAK]